MRQAAGDEGIFDFEFSDPEADRLNHADHFQYSFETRMTNRTTGASYKVEDLSSGETILMALCMAWFNQSMGRKRPALLLLDELDAMLHPSMVGALVSCLKDLFVRQGTKVMLATHCPATLAVLEDGEVFRVSRRDRGQVRIRPVTRSEAVEELSDGIATLDTGLRIATADARPVTIVTEGKNALILRRWAVLYFPDDVFVFDRLFHRTGAAELQSYARVLSKMESNSRLLFVWDCDQGGKIDKLAEDIGPGRAGHAACPSVRARRDGLWARRGRPGRIVTVAGEHHSRPGRNPRTARPRPTGVRAPARRRDRQPQTGRSGGRVRRGSRCKARTSVRVRLLLRPRTVGREAGVEPKNAARPV